MPEQNYMFKCVSKNYYTTNNIKSSFSWASAQRSKTHRRRRCRDHERVPKQKYTHPHHHRPQPHHQQETSFICDARSRLVFYIIFLFWKTGKYTPLYRMQSSVCALNRFRIYRAYIESKSMQTPPVNRSATTRPTDGV